MTTETVSSFSELGLSSTLCQTISRLGYEQPSAIQEQSIPPLLEGRDLLGVAQTGTGKTAAFALPLLERLDGSERSPAIIVLTPTRELCIQVAEAFETYAEGLKKVRVLPIYGGQDMGSQLRQLKKGIQVVVGTPGRVIDHLKRKTLNLSALKSMVLDEADEMLRMGFIDDVEWILEQTPSERQMALFSATMPGAIKRISSNYLNNPVEVRIESATRTVDSIEQTYIAVSGGRKLQALDLVLETENSDAVIVFVRTKNSAQDLAQKLEARGYRSAAIHGDLNQRQRELCIRQLKESVIDVMVATDVAARGIDVTRITHVINYDIPYDSESYIHRIGRTGRAGRSGKAILFVMQRERRMLKTIERTTGQPVKPVQLPTADELRKIRLTRFGEKIKATLENKSLDKLRGVLSEIKENNGFSDEDLAVALAFMSQKTHSLIVSDRDVSMETGRKTNNRNERDRDRNRGKERNRDRGARDRRDDSRGRNQDRRRDETRSHDRRPDRDNNNDKPHKSGSQRRSERENIPMQTYQLSVGRSHSVRVGDILGAVANELDIESKHIGNIRLEDDSSTIELPEGMPKDVFQDFKKVRIRSYPANPRLANSSDEKPRPEADRRDPHTRSRPPAKKPQGKLKLGKNSHSNRKPAGNKQRRK